MHMNKATFALLCASAATILPVDAFDATADQNCWNKAYVECSATGGVDTHSDGYKYYWAKCIKGFWQGLTTNTNCPHPDGGCLCYNGCVIDRSPDETDVGGWCTVVCKIPNGPQPYKC